MRLFPCNAICFVRKKYLMIPLLISGISTTLSTNNQRHDSSNSQSVEANDHQVGNIMLTGIYYNLQNGDKLVTIPFIIFMSSLLKFSFKLTDCISNEQKFTLYDTVIFFIRWTFNIVYIVGRAIHEFRNPINI